MGRLLVFAKVYLKMSVNTQVCFFNTLYQIVAAVGTSTKAFASEMKSRHCCWFQDNIFEQPISKPESNEVQTFKEQHGYFPFQGFAYAGSKALMRNRMHVFTNANTKESYQVMK